MPQKDRRVVCGFNAVGIAVQMNRASLLFVGQRHKDKPDAARIMELAAKNKINVKQVSDNEIDEIATGRKTQGICCLCKDTPSPGAEELYGHLPHLENNSVILLLDSVTDPHNFGAILRSAEATGVKYVVIEKRHSPPVSDAVVSASAGASEIIPVVRVTNLKGAVDELKKNGFWIAGASEKSRTNIWDADMSGKIAFVLGSEGYGVRESLLKKCDLLIAIPMLGQIPSLNVSVSAAVILYEKMRQSKNEEH